MRVNTTTTRKSTTSSPRSSPANRSKKLSSPPMSPSTSTGYTSDDEKLEGSFLFVSGEEDDSSTIGSSTRDSINGDIFSDSSNEEHREPWEGSTDGSESETADTHVHDHSTDEVDGVLLTSPELGSYIDAEATATYTDMGHSRSTIHRGLHSLNSSQVRLIMPDPVSSFLTSSDGTTPSASYGNLKQIPDMPSRLPKGVDKEWLEASSRLWNVAPEVQVLLDDNKSGQPRFIDDSGAYQLLASQDIQNKDEKVSEQSDETEEARLVQIPRRRFNLHQLRTILRDANLGRFRDFGKKWSTSISVLALASLLSVALVHSFSTSANRGTERSMTPSTNGITIPSLLSSGRTASIWDRLSMPVEASTTQTLPVDRSVPTGLIPDLHLIKQALSTLSTISTKGSAGSTSADGPDIIANKPGQDAPNHRKRKAAAMSDSACCAVSVRKSDSLAAIQQAPLQPATTDKVWARAIRRKLSGQHSQNGTEERIHRAMTNQTESLEPCACLPSHHLRADFVSYLIRTVLPVQQHLNSSLQTLASIYAPVRAELLRDYAELIALSRSLAEATSTLAEFVIRRAARGLGVSRQTVDRLTRSVRAHLPVIPVPHVPHIDTRALLKARQSIDHLSELVEEQAVAFADFVEEQSTILQERSVDSLRQARRGLDKVIREARKAVGDEQSSKDVIREPLPKVIQRKELSGRQARERLRSLKREMRAHRTAERGYTRRGEATSRFKIEQPSRGRKIWDAIHHGAMALVV